MDVLWRTVGRIALSVLWLLRLLSIWDGFGDRIMNVLLLLVPMCVLYACVQVILNCFESESRRLGLSKQDLGDRPKLMLFQGDLGVAPDGWFRVTVLCGSYSVLRRPIQEMRPFPAASSQMLYPESENIFEGLMCHVKSFMF